MNDKKNKNSSSSDEESLEQQIDAFLKSGKKIQEINPGLVKEDLNKRRLDIFIEPPIDISKVKPNK